MFTTDFDIIIFAETSLYVDIVNEKFSNNDFDVFRNDRPKRVGGSTLIATRRCLRGRLLFSSANISYNFFVPCKLLDKKIIIGKLYIPPSSPLSCYESLFTILESLQPLINDSEVILAGDFNLPHIHWYNASAITYYATDDDTLPANEIAAETLCNL